MEKEKRNEKSLIEVEETMDSEDNLRFPSIGFENLGKFEFSKMKVYEKNCEEKGLKCVEKESV